MSDHYDVIVIGSGAGGGTVAHMLAPTGKRISCSNGAGSCLGNPELGPTDPLGSC
jgi:pyruvate/2-oxoglutarate dehydrogenase complex dihydrolipoamide dehydrogenase (E3) component